LSKLLFHLPKYHLFNSKFHVKIGHFVQTWQNPRIFPAKRACPQKKSLHWEIRLSQKRQIISNLPKYFQLKGRPVSNGYDKEFYSSQRRKGTGINEGCNMQILKISRLFSTMAEWYATSFKPGDLWFWFSDLSIKLIFERCQRLIAKKNSAAHGRKFRQISGVGVGDGAGPHPLAIFFSTFGQNLGQFGKIWLGLGKNQNLASPKTFGAMRQIMIYFCEIHKNNINILAEKMYDENGNGLNTNMRSLNNRWLTAQIFLEVL